MPFEIPDALQGPSLALRPLRAEDLRALPPVLQDPALWAQHPAKERGTPEGSRAYVRWLLEQGGAMLVTDAEGAAGTSRYYQTPDLPGGAWAIGYTVLARRLWGGAANREMKALMLAPLFEAVDACWFHIAPGNLRSQRATAKLGAVFVDEIDRNGPTQRWRLARGDWTGGAD